MDAILEAVNDEIFGIWFLIGAALVFFMQCGFAMVETGFTRAKNAGNIIMKNLMDFCIGTPMFLLLGFGLMMGEEVLGGFCGLPTLGIFKEYSDFNWSNFVFNLVFCATTATIVSGAMAERTKFSSYCIYSAIISALVYPIEAGWIWNENGWLANLGFHDFAGSCAIHMVGGISALIGAIFVGPRIGKYVVNKTSGEQLSSIFLTTTCAPAVATCVTMIFTWIKNGKPDVSMSLNGSLAGLVAVTAGCDVVDALGSCIIGAVSGFLVVIAVEFIDIKLKIDDPVGAVAVHMANGIWGTLAVGLFATTSVPGNDEISGLFYGGGFSLFGTQALGVITVAAWTAVTMSAIFFVLKKTNGLRASREEELKGLDATEHNLPSAYADFMPTMALATASGNAPASIPKVSVEKAIPVESYTTNTNGKLTNVVMVFNPSKFEEVKEAMNEIGVTGMTVTNVMGCGTQKGHSKMYRGVAVEELSLNPKMKLEMAISKVPVKTVIEAARAVLYTGNIGDGKIFLYNLEDVVKVRTGEHGTDALQGEEDLAND